MRHPITNIYRIQEAVSSLKNHTPSLARFPRVAVVLGSGLGIFADELEQTPNALTIPYGKIDHFPEPAVSGHSGKLVLTDKVAALSGRIHSYEGYDAETIVLPIRTLVKCGARIIILTNAVGSLSTQNAYHPGNLVIIKSHINLIPDLNPLRGPFDPYIMREEFTDLGNLYDRELRQKTQELNLALDDSPLPEGILSVISSGRSYETPAEINYLRRQGIDLVGMSVVAEAIAAHAMPERPQVLGISCVTNLAAGINAVPLSHNDITESAREARPRFISLLKALVEEFSKNHH